jgi:hypothetical protein
MTVRIRLIALAIALLGTGPIAASPDPIVPRTPHVALGLLKAGNDRFARNLGKSTLLQHLVDGGRLGVVGAYYELVSGRVIFSELVTAETAAARPASH